MLADQRFCPPLTITDFASRNRISCDALSTTQEAYAFSVFEHERMHLALKIEGTKPACPTKT